MTEDTSLREKALRATKLHFRLNALIRDAFFHGRGRGNLALLSEADQAAWMDYDVSEYEQYKSIVAAFHASEAKDRCIEALEAALNTLSKEADAAYRRSLDQFSKPECCGFEIKASTGKFGAPEHEAHKKANVLMGKHQGMYAVIKAVRAALSGKEGQS